MQHSFRSFVVILLTSFPCVSFAATGHFNPLVTYSEQSACDGMARRGFFDVTYFNAVVAVGSKVSIRYGFVTADENVHQGLQTFEFLLPESVVMKQWEEFGWFIRLRPDLFCDHLPSPSIVGLNFIIEIREPNGHVAVVPQVRSDGLKRYFRAITPDMNRCDESVNEDRKVCMAEVEQVSGS